MTKWVVATVAAAMLAATGWIAWVLCEPEVPRAVLEAEYATPPSRFIVLKDGARIHYRIRGPEGAPVLVLLHGFSGSLFVWEGWSRTLSDRFRVAALDLPGNGLTGAVPSGDYSEAAMASGVVAFADALGLRKFAIGGNSMGGAVAARIAELRPDRVTRLILVDAAGARTNTRRRLHLAYAVAHVPVLNRLFIHLIVEHNSPFARMAGTREANLAHIRLPDDTYVWDHVQSIKAPTLILWGANDATIPIASALAWHRAIPGSKLIVYPGAGHVAMLDAPAQSAREVREFLGGAAP